jgi:NAD(P)-dependent dehydrogenase (short-subunit alcohol dehydrogenase family)
MIEKLPSMIPVRRLGTAYDDLARVVVFLASEGAGYLNGNAFAANGGSKLIA